MKRPIAGLATPTVLVSGGVGLAALGLGAGNAQADPLPPHTWCPGAPMAYSDFDPSTGPGVAYQWDMNVCTRGTGLRAVATFHIRASCRAVFGTETIRRIVRCGAGGTW